jgi:hypothetical protein
MRNLWLEAPRVHVQDGQLRRVVSPLPSMVERRGLEALPVRVPSTLRGHTVVLMDDPTIGRIIDNDDTLLVKGLNIVHDQPSSLPPSSADVSYPQKNVSQTARASPLRT